jgi:hypothetical protein
MTIQDKHKKAASRKWQQYVCLFMYRLDLGADGRLSMTRARGGKVASTDRDSTKPASAKPPTNGRPLALANPLPSGKQNSDDDSEEEQDEDQGDDADEGPKASTESPPGQFCLIYQDFRPTLSLALLSIQDQTRKEMAPTRDLAVASWSRIRTGTRRRPRRPSQVKKVSNAPLCL